MSRTDAPVWPPEIQKLIDEGVLRPPLHRARRIGLFEPLPGIRDSVEVLEEDRGE